MSPPIKYDRYGRMAYHPDYHPNHKKPFKTSEQKYLIENYAIHGPETVALALGRTIGGVMTRANALRKAGQMPKYNQATARHKRVRAS